jgi:hypothetical protein
LAEKPVRACCVEFNLTGGAVLSAQQWLVLLVCVLCLQPTARLAKAYELFLGELNSGAADVLLAVAAWFC